MYLIKTKKSKCGYGSEEMLHGNLKQHCKIEMSKDVDVQHDLRKTSKEKKIKAIMEII